MVQALGWVGIGWACAEWTPIEVGDKSMTGRPFSDLVLHAAVHTAKLPCSTFCWLLMLLLISRDLVNFNSISRPSLRPHRAFCRLGDRHPTTAGKLLGLDTAAKMRQRPAAGLSTAQRWEYLQVTSRIHKDIISVYCVQRGWLFVRSPE